jgi:hypothetical protein
MKSLATGLEVSGSKLLAVCGYDHRLCGAVIALQEDSWKELLQTVGAEQLRRNVAMVVGQIREALGKDFDYAKEITQGQA